MKPILLEIVTRMLTSWGQCGRCSSLLEQTGLDQKFRDEEMEGYPPDLKKEVTRLSDWIGQLNRLYKHRLHIKIIDAQSFSGFYRSLRYRIRNYPTFIVDGKETYTGWDRGELEKVLDKHLANSFRSRCQSLRSHSNAQGFGN